MSIRYLELFDYGAPAEGAPAANGAEGGDDPDGELVPALVLKLVLPAARAAMEAAWNPRSRRQSRNVAALMRVRLLLARWH